MRRQRTGVGPNMLKSKLVSPSHSPSLEPEKHGSMLDSFARKPSSFGVREVAECWGAGSNLDSIHDKLVQDRRFLRVYGQQVERAYFIADASLFHWMAQLNLRLARDSVAILSRQEFVNELTDLSDQAAWTSPPQAVLNFGSNYGLVGTANTDDQYTFPLAWTLSRLSPTILREVAEALRDLEDLDTRSWWLNRSIDAAVEDGLANFPENEVTVIRGREDLSGEGRLVLQELGRRLNLTRERERQLEAQFWRKLLGPSQYKKRASRMRWKITSAELRRAFVNAFLSDWMRGHGSLLAVDTSIEAKLRLFCAKCIGLPIATVPQTHGKVIGALPCDLTALESTNWDTKCYWDKDSIVSSLARSLPLVTSDLHIMAADARSVWLRHASKEQKVSLVLRAIGRPAHHSEVATSYRSMFPEDQTKDRTIHVILTRRRHGVIWSGSRGIYALNEWQQNGPMPAYQKFAKKDIDNREGAA